MQTGSADVYILPAPPIAALQLANDYAQHVSPQCRLDDLQHTLVMSGTPLEVRAALMNVLAAIPQQHDSSALGSQPGMLPAAPRQPSWPLQGETSAPNGVYVSYTHPLTGNLHGSQAGVLPAAPRKPSWSLRGETANTSIGAQNLRDSFPRG